MSINNEKPTLIKVDHVCKSYGAVNVLNDVNVEFKPGEVVAILGASGSGKSTFLRLLNRLERHEQGTIVIDGVEVIDKPSNLSALRGAEFIENYGVAIADGPLKGLTARAVVVLDENDNVLHSELVKEIAEEPNYEAALAVLK